MTHNELKQSALQKPAVQAAYEALEPEFALLRQMLQARQEVGISQAEIAKGMGTKPIAVRKLQGSDYTFGSLAAPSPDEVRDKLEALQIMEEDIADAVTWARDSYRRANVSIAIDCSWRWMEPWNCTT